MSETCWWTWYAEFSHTATNLAANLLIQTTLIVAAGLVLAGLLWRGGAALRSVVLRMTLCAALLCPVASWSLGIGGVSGVGVTLPTLLQAESKTSRPISTHSSHDAGSRLASHASVDRRMDSAGPVFQGGDQAKVVSDSALADVSSPGVRSAQAVGEERVGSDAAVPMDASATGKSALMPYSHNSSALSMVYCGLVTIWFMTAIVLTVRIGIAYVITYGGDPGLYARQLVDIAEAFQVAWATQCVGVGVMSSRASLARRVRRLLDTRQSRSIRPGRGSLLLVACLAMCGTLAVGMIGAGATEEARELAGSNELPRPKATEEQLAEVLSVSRPAKRGDPQLFAPLEVEAEGTSCTGAMKLRRGEVAGEPINIIAVKALVPYEKQAAAYESVLAPAVGYSPRRDVPKYLFFIAERAGVPDDPDAPLDWKAISNSDYAIRQSRAFNAIAQEVADEAYILPGVLTTAMPHIQSTTSDSLSLHSKVPRRLERERPESQVDDEQRHGEGVSDRGNDVTSRSNYKMVRFLDLTAELGKSYTYRIAVGLEDPSRPRDPKADPDKRILDPKAAQRLEEVISEDAADMQYVERYRKLKRTSYRQTEWSEPSNIVAVPQTPAGEFLIDVLPPRQRKPSQESEKSAATESERQNEHQYAVLRWPLELGEDFVAAVRPLRPIETKVDFPTPAAQELNIDLRIRYAKYVDHILPAMARSIGSRWDPQSNAVRKNDIRGASGQGASDTEREPAGIYWDPANQKRLLENHFDWSSQPGGTPSTLQTLYAQEDLRVLQAILHIIRKTNDKGSSNDGAVVKTVEHIRFGRDTEFRGDAIDRRDPADSRYVDGNGESLSGEQLRSAMQSAPDDPGLAIAKRVPVHMKLTMDRQHLDKLLVACAEMPLPLEVRQVRLDSIPLPDRRGEASNEGTTEKEPRAGNQGRQPHTSVPHSVDVAVELDALIYIYSPTERTRQ